MRHLATLLLAGALSSPVQAQAGLPQPDEPARTRVWAAAGLGAGLPTSGGDGIANMAQLVAQRGAHHFALRGLILHDIERETSEIGEVGALYGRTFAIDRLNGAMAGGISYGVFSTCPDDDDGCFAFGVPVVAEAALGGRFAGVGVQAFGNVNPKASWAGAVVFVQVGRVR